MPNSPILSAAGYDYDQESAWIYGDGEGGNWRKPKGGWDDHALWNDVCDQDRLSPAGYDYSRPDAWTASEDARFSHPVGAPLGGWPDHRAWEASLPFDPARPKIYNWPDSDRVARYLISEGEMLFALRGARQDDTLLDCSIDAIAAALVFTLDTRVSPGPRELTLRAMLDDWREYFAALRSGQLERDRAAPLVDGQPSRTTPGLRSVEEALGSAFLNTMRQRLKIEGHDASRQGVVAVVSGYLENEGKKANG